VGARRASRAVAAATCSSSCKQRVAATMAPVAVALRAGCGDGVSSSVVSGSHDDGDGRWADGDDDGARPLEAEERDDEEAVEVQT
jgi:hypothetical protein